MGYQPQSDEELLLAFMPDYLDDALPSEYAGRFAGLLADEAHAALVERYRTRRGQMQEALQAVSLSEQQAVRMLTLVEDPEHKRREEAQIERVGRLVTNSNLIRGALFGVVIVGIVAFLADWFIPDSKPRFDLLRWLFYETVVIEESPGDRLDFIVADGDWDDVELFFRKQASLGFKPRLMERRHTPEWREWQPIGTKIITYDEHDLDVGLVSYRNERRYLHYLTFQGTLEDLPDAPQGNSGPLIYQTYSSDAAIWVAWQQADNIVGMLVANEDADRLARMARLGSGL